MSVLTFSLEPSVVASGIDFSRLRVPPTLFRCVATGVSRSAEREQQSSAPDLCLFRRKKSFSPAPLHTT